MGEAALRVAASELAAVENTILPASNRDAGPGRSTGRGTDGGHHEALAFLDSTRGLSIELSMKKEVAVGNG